MAKAQTKTLAEVHEKTFRASISFPPDLYHTLEEIAKQKKVSLAWIIRDAAEKYVADQWPLFERARREK